MVINPQVDQQFQLAFGLHQQNLLVQAQSAYAAVLQIDPYHDKSLHMLGYISGQMGDFVDAVSQISKAVELNPTDSAYFLNRGNAYLKLNQYEKAIADFDKSIGLSSDVPEAYLARGTAHHESKNLLQAVADYSLAINLNPECAEAFFNMGHALLQFKKPHEASLHFFKALEIQPDFDFLIGTCLHTKMKLCDWDLLSDGLQLLESELNSLKKVTTPFAALSLLDDPQLHLKAAQIYGEYKFPEKNSLGTINQRPTKDKIRVAYFSADFHNHATSYLMAEIFENHDRQKFEVYGFSFGPNSHDAMRIRLLKGFDHFIDVSQKSDLEVAELARHLQIDIAVDLKGYTEDCRTGIFAQRCAPIQVNYLGYPGSMGVSYMDYVIADAVVIPEKNHAHYSEKIVYLPHCYQANDSKRSISDKQFKRSDFGLPEDSFVFCCFNNGYKIQPKTFASWMHILKSVEGSVLWLFEDNPMAASNLQQKAEKNGVDANRLIFASRMSMEEHLARHQLADLLLDTLPYNAHTTASDALWAGLPVLTCMGESFASRVAASLLTAIELPELITTNASDYEVKAIQLATDSQQLSDLKARLSKNKSTSPLFNGIQFIGHLETAFEKMHQIYLSGASTKNIKVKAD